MTSPLKIIATCKETCRRNKAIFQEYIEFASVRHHPAFKSIPQSSKLPTVTQFLKNWRAVEIWNKGDMHEAVAELTLRLDSDWPEWAMTRTNVLGILLSNLFIEFIPWLEQLPVHARSNCNLVGVCFEKSLFAEAHARHYSKFWHNRLSFTPDWFHVYYSEDKARMDVGHPVVKTATSKAMISWRAYHTAEIYKVSWFADVISEDDYIYV